MSGKTASRKTLVEVHKIAAGVAGQLVLIVESGRGLSAAVIEDAAQRLRDAADTLLTMLPPESP